MAKTIKRHLTLTLSFSAQDEGAAVRRIRAMLKWLWRSWSMRCVTIAWSDEQEAPPRTPIAGAVGSADQPPAEAAGDFETLTDDQSVARHFNHLGK